MRCRPLRWLFGLPGLALIAAIALFGELPHIRVDLRDRTNAALEAAGQDWAKLDLDARDAHVSGTAASEREQQAALDTVRSIWGVRIAGDETSLIAALRPYAWSLKREGAKIEITGYADSEANRKAVGLAAESQFRGLTVEQHLKLARGMPLREQWLSAIQYSSRLTSGLIKGNARLDDLGLSISGEAASPQDYANILKALAGDRPPGLELVQVEITPPVVNPYTWSATWTNRALTLDGFIADDGVRKQLLEAADGLFPGATVTDRMLLAGGEPAMFGPAREQALRGLAQLESGKATLKGVNADLRGVAVEQETAERVSGAFHVNLPSSYRATESISFRKAKLLIAKPYLWSADYSGHDLVMEGFVPDDRTRNDLTALAASQFKGARIVDRTAIAAGMPSGFAKAAQSALQQLARLDRGRARLVDATIELNGHATDKAIAKSAEDDFVASLPPGYAPATGVTYDLPKVVVVVPVKPPEPPKPIEKPKVVAPPKPIEKPKVVELPKPVEKPKVVELPKPVEKPKVVPQPKPVAAAPYVWDALVDNGNVVLNGTIPNEAARNLVHSLVNSRLPGINLIDNLTTGGSLPASDEDWLRGIDAGLKAVADLGGGRAHLAERSLTVTGITRDKAMPDYVAESLRRAMPTGFASNSQVDYQAPVEPDAYLTTLKYDGLKVVVEGAVPDQAARTKLMAQLRPLFPDREFDDRTELRKGAPDGWLQALTLGLGPLAQLDAGQLSLRNRSLTISGTTEDEKILAGARKKVGTSLPKGYAGSDQLVYVAPPKPDPKLLAQRQDESKYNVKKLIQQSSALSAPECQAVLNSVIRGKAFFASGRSELDVHATAALNSVVALARRCSGTRVEISGHTDSDGAAAFNQRLSERRAQSVVNYLQQQGVGTEQLNAVGYGEVRPIVPNDTFANKAKNRRIDISVTQTKG